MCAKREDRKSYLSDSATNAHENVCKSLEKYFTFIKNGKIKETFVDHKLYYHTEK